MQTGLEFLLSVSSHKGILYLENLGGVQLKKPPCMLTNYFWMFLALYQATTGAELPYIPLITPALPNRAMGRVLDEKRN